MWAPSLPTHIPRSRDIGRDTAEKLDNRPAVLQQQRGDAVGVAPRRDPKVQYDGAFGGSQLDDEFPLSGEAKSMSVFSVLAATGVQNFLYRVEREERRPQRNRQSRAQRRRSYGSSSRDGTAFE